MRARLRGKPLRRREKKAGRCGQVRMSAGQVAACLGHCDRPKEESRVGQVGQISTERKGCQATVTARGEEPSQEGTEQEGAGRSRKNCAGAVGRGKGLSRVNCIGGSRGVLGNGQETSKGRQHKHALCSERGVWASLLELTHKHTHTKRRQEQISISIQQQQQHTTRWGQQKKKKAKKGLLVHVCAAAARSLSLQGEADRGRTRWRRVARPGIGCSYVGESAERTGQRRAKNTREKLGGCDRRREGAPKRAWVCCSRAAGEGAEGGKRALVGFRGLDGRLQSRRVRCPCLEALQHAGVGRH